MGVECSQVACGVALVVGDRLWERRERAQGEQLKVLFPMLLETCAEAGVPVAECRLAVAIGPGSFTGLRLALATVKTMAQVLGRGVVPVRTLDVVAWGCAAWAMQAGAWCDDVAVLTDARKGQVFCAAYAVTREGFRLREIAGARPKRRNLSPVR